MKRKYYLSIILSVILLSGCAMSWGDAYKEEKKIGGVYEQGKDFVGGLNPLAKLILTLGTTGLIATGVIKTKRAIEKKGKKK